MEWSKQMIRNRSTKCLNLTDAESSIINARDVKRYPTEPSRIGSAFMVVVVLKTELGSFESRSDRPVGAWKSSKAKYEGWWTI
jgi:hypothetical protein